MADERELTTISLTEGAHGQLQSLKQRGYFKEMADGFRFAVALALAHGAIAPQPSGGRTTFLNVGSLDPDRALHLAVSTLREPTGETVYRTVERLAEWGIEELSRRADTGTLSVAEVLQEAESLIGGGSKG